MRSRQPMGGCHWLAIEIYGYRYIAADWTGFLSLLLRFTPSALRSPQSRCYRQLLQCKGFILSGYCCVSRKRNVLLALKKTFAGVSKSDTGGYFLIQFTLVLSSIVNIVNISPLSQSFFEKHLPNPCWCSIVRLLIGERFDTRGDAITPPPHFSTLIK